MASARSVCGLVVGLYACTLTACSLSVGYDGSRYACEPPSGACPDGFVCAGDGFCVPAGSAVPDADVPLADAATGAADAAAADAPAADAALPDGPLPDAPGTPVTVAFGERATSDVQGVTFDTYLSSVNQIENKGANTNLACTTDSDRTPLLRFDLSAIPTGATVIGATLEVWTSSDSSASAARVFPVLEAWTEGNQVDASGVANWDLRQAGTAWAGEGATPPSRGTLFVAEFLPASPDTPYTMMLPTTLVQGWVSTPAANFGVAITPVTSNSDFELKSSESSFDERRPQLTITYVP